MSKTISLIIPTRGREANLIRLLGSLRQHGYLDRPNIEVVIADNNPSAAEMEAVRTACKRFGAVFVHEDQPGKAFAVNTAARHAHGTFLAFTDDDTVVAQPDWLEQLMAPFSKHPQLAYVSGNVIALNASDNVAGMWEKKGGLSKGQREKYWSRDYLSQPIFRVIPWQFNKICAGANSMIRRDVFEAIGGFSIILEGFGPFRAGATIEIGHRIVRAGYELMYTPQAVIFHQHPTDGADLTRKLFSYGQGDTGYQMLCFLEYGDLRCLWWALFGHSCYTIAYKLARRLVGRYPMPVRYILAGLAGNIIGGPRLAWHYLTHAHRQLLEYRRVQQSTSIKTENL